mgnify:FL=1
MAKPVFFPVMVIFLLLAPLISGCGGEQEPPLRIGTNLWPGYEPLNLPRDLGSSPSAVSRPASSSRSPPTPSPQSNA